MNTDVLPPARQTVITEGEQLVLPFEMEKVNEPYEPDVIDVLVEGA